MLSAAEIQQIIRTGVPMAGESELCIDEVTDKQVRARFPFKPNMVRPGGTLSGPTIMSLADAAMYAVILARIGHQEMAVTSNLNINFLARPLPADLIAYAEIVKLGKRLAFCEVRLFSEGGDEMVAHVTGSYSLPPAEIK